MNEGLKELFEAADKKVYKKRGTFLYRNAIEGETILTICAGKLETIKTAGADEVVLRNIEVGSSAELYIIAKDQFEKRYDAFPDEQYNVEGTRWYKATAKGRAEAFEYKGEAFEFMAPWNELMVCEDRDFLARPIPGDENDIYRIERQTFEQTYQLESIEQGVEHGKDSSASGN